MNTSLVNCSECLDSGWLFYAPSNRPGVMIRLHPTDPRTRNVQVPASHLVLEPCKCQAGSKMFKIETRESNDR